MNYELNLDILPEYHLSAYKKFSANEKHITRICNEDVLIIMLSGVLYFNEEGQPIELYPNQYYIQKSGLKQEGIIPSDNAEYYYIHFKGNFEDCKNSLKISGNVQSELIKPLFDKLELLFYSGSLTEKHACFFEILSRLKGNEYISKYKKIIQNISADIYKNPNKPISLELLAKRYTYSKNQLINIFKSETGQTPYCYITNMRLIRAKQLLASSITPINLIAEQTGFDNYINFYKAFKKSEGCSPLEFRIKMQSQ